MADTYDALFEVQRVIRELMSEGVNPTADLIRLRLARDGWVYSIGQVRRVLRAGIRVGMLAGPGRGGRSGYRITGSVPDSRHVDCDCLACRPWTS